MVSSIRAVTLDDIVGLERYEAMRDEWRRRIIALKQHRRVSVGNEVTFVFENHATMSFQVHEMLRAERITDLDGVREELAVYNALLPKPGQLSATMLIEITEHADIAARLVQMIGIDEAVQLQIGDGHVAAEFEPGRSTEEKLSAVQYVRFSLPPALRSAFRDATVPVRLRIDHPNYRADTAISGEIRQSLSEDLAEAD
jgi:hypothetical protein